MDDFIEKMADILEEDATALTFETRFRELDSWDSLAQLSFLVMAQDDYSKSLVSEDLEGASTVEDLYKLVIG